MGKSTSRTSYINPDNPRYPRSAWFRLIRAGVITLRWWAMILILVLILYCGVLILGSIFDSETSLVLVLALLLVTLSTPVLFLLLKRWSKKDEGNERRVLLERARKWEEHSTSSRLTLRHKLGQQNDTVLAVAWSPKAAILAARYAPDGKRPPAVKLWDADTGELLHTLIPPKRSIFLSILMWLSGGKTFSSLVWSSGGKTLSSFSLYLEAQAFSSLAWSPDGQTLVVGTLDKTIYLWDVNTGQLLHTLQRLSAPVMSLAWSPDGRFLAVGFFDGTIRLWDTQTEQFLTDFKRYIHEKDTIIAVTSLAWSPDSTTLAIGFNSNKIWLWDIQTKQLLQTFTAHATRGDIDFSAVFDLAWFPNGHILAAGTYDGTIRLWDTQTREHRRTLKEHKEAVVCLSFSFDGRLLASKSQDNTVRLWRTDTWEATTLLHEFASDGISHGLAFHEKLPVLATVGERDSCIRIWDLDSKTLANILPESHLDMQTEAEDVPTEYVGKEGWTDTRFIPGRRAFVNINPSASRRKNPLPSILIPIGIIFLVLALLSQFVLYVFNGLPSFGGVTSPQAIGTTKVASLAIVAYYPTRPSQPTMVVGQSTSVTLEIYFTGAQSDVPTAGTTGVSATPIPPIGTPDVPIAKTFGPKYDAFVLANAVSSTSLDAKLAGPAEQSLEQQDIKWIWNVTPRQEASSSKQGMDFDIEGEWKLKNGGQIKMRPLGRVHLDVEVASTSSFIVLGQVNVIGLLGGLGTLLGGIITAVILKRMDIREQRRKEQQNSSKDLQNKSTKTTKTSKKR